MHPLHDYVAKQLAERLKSKKLVVWYDARSEFAPFIAEVRGGARAGGALLPVAVAATTTLLAEYDGSLFELLLRSRIGLELPDDTSIGSCGSQQSPAFSSSIRTEPRRSRSHPGK